MKTIQFLIFAVFATLSLTSCLEEKPLENDKPINPQSISDMQKIFVKATNGLTPMSMGKGEWALWRLEARLYNGAFQGLGFKANQVMAAANGDIVVENQSYPVRELNIVTTEYKEPTNDQEWENPVVDLQKEWNCKFVKPPYWIWYGECELEPEQNFLLFQSFNEPKDPVYFNPIVTTKREKLPQKLIDENRCYNFENCEIDVTYVEYDIWFNGQRAHYKTAFSGELPYLASNLSTCFTSQFDINGVKHPGELCKTLVNFLPGEAPPPDNGP